MAVLWQKREAEADLLAEVVVVGVVGVEFVLRLCMRGTNTCWVLTPGKKTTCPWRLGMESLM